MLKNEGKGFARHMNSSARRVSRSGSHRVVVVSGFGLDVERRQCLATDELLVARQGLQALELLRFVNFCERSRARRQQASPPRKKNAMAQTDTYVEEARFQNTIQRAMFLLWKQVTTEQRSRHSSLRKRIKQLYLRMAWVKWKQYLAYHRLLQSLMNRWKAFVEQRRRALERMLASWRMRVLRDSLKTWKRAQERRSKLLEQLVWRSSGFAIAIRNHHLRRGFRVWKRLAYEYRRRQSIEMIIRVVQTRILRHSWHTWKCFCKYHADSEEQALKHDNVLGRPPCSYIKKNYRAMKGQRSNQENHRQQGSSTNAAKKKTSKRRKGVPGPYLVRIPEDKRYHLTREELLRNRILDSRHLLRKVGLEEQPRRIEESKEEKAFELWTQEEIILTNSFVPGGHRKLQQKPTRSSSTYWI